MTMKGLGGWMMKLLGAGHSKVPNPLPSTAVLVDVRSETEFLGGYIEGAVSLPLDRIHVEIGKAVPDQNTLIVLYCRSGARSGHACAVLSQLGYQQVVNGGGIGGLAMTLDRRLVSPRVR